MDEQTAIGYAACFASGLLIGWRVAFIWMEEKAREMALEQEKNRRG